MRNTLRATAEEADQRLGDVSVGRLACSWGVSNELYGEETLDRHRRLEDDFWACFRQIASERTYQNSLACLMRSEMAAISRPPSAFFVLDH